MISLRSKITKEVLSNFFLHEESSLYVNEIARLFGLDRGNLIRKLKVLEYEGILKSEFKGNQKYYSLNKSYSLLAEYKKIILKTVGFENKIRDLLKRIKGIKEAYIWFLCQGTIECLQRFRYSGNRPAGYNKASEKDSPITKLYWPRDQRNKY